MSVKVRALTEDDSEDFRCLRLEALEGETHAFGESPEEHRASNRQLVDSADSFVMGAFEEGRLVGTVGFARRRNMKSRHKGTIWGVYVTPGFRSQGIARALFSELISRVRREPGMEQIALSVGTEENAAKRLYLSLGFVPYGLEVHALKVGEHYVDQDHMVLRLR